MTTILTDPERREVLRVWSADPDSRIEELLCKNEAAVLAKLREQAIPIPQWHKAGCADWYDGHPDHTDGGGPYETRTLYATALSAVGPVPQDLVGLLDDVIDHAWNDGVLRKDKLMDDRTLVARQKLLDALADPLPAVVQVPQDDDYIGGLEYRGNSVAYIHQKLTSYRALIDEAWQAMRDAGRGPDGKTPLPDAIRVALAAPEAPAQGEREAFQAGYEAAQSDAQVCDLPPLGWRCTRTAGHDGPCAAIEAPEDVAFVERGMDRLRETDAAPEAPGQGSYKPCPQCGANTASPNPANWCACPKVAAPEAPAQAIPTPWREAVKVAREAMSDLVPMVEAMLMIHGTPEPGSVGHKARAALAQLDALEGGE